MARATKFRFRRAYTLIELLLVVAILGIASALLVPQILAKDSMTVQAAVRQLIADMSFAQADALAHQEFRRVAFFDDGSGYALVRADDFADFNDPFDPDTANYVDDPLAGSAEQARYIVDFNDPRFEGVSITGVAIDGSSEFVTYDALGGTVRGAQTPGTGGTITMAYGEQIYEIEVAAFTGKLTVVKQ
ncbi:MAG: pilus assembly FimT family protein [Planctomycetota bacterium]|jgi:prepilin-type N-terminal cleavage/methylation domain-containing protein